MLLIVSAFGVFDNVNILQVFSLSSYEKIIPGKRIVVVSQFLSVTAAESGFRDCSILLELKELGETRNAYNRILGYNERANPFSCCNMNCLPDYQYWGELSL